MLLEGSPMRRPRTARIGSSARIALTVGAIVAAAVAGPLTAGATTAAVTSANLILNGDAETSQCSPGGWEETTMPGWRITTADPVIDCYGARNDALTTTPGSPTAGTAYFQGGGRGTSQMTQTADVSSAAAAIDAGGVHSTLSGWLGGVGSYNDAAKLTITYRNASGGSLGTASVGPVLAADRGSVTKFLQRSVTSAVPAGTRSILTTVDFTMTGTKNDGLADDIALTLDTAVTAPTLTVPASTVPGFDHVFVMMMENRDYSEIVGSANAPYINNTLIPMGTLFNNFYAGTHNSDPNYEQIGFGNSYGRSNQGGAAPYLANCITDTRCTATNNGLSDNLDAMGKTWKQYTQTQTSNCQTTGSGEYAPDDVPFYYAAKMKNDNAYCQAHWQPLPQLLNTDLASTATTPNFVWFDADSCYDMEDCGVSSGDTWMSQTLPTLFNSPAWKTQKSLFILTFDEDGNGTGGPGGWGPGQTNQIMTLAIGSPGTVRAGYVDSNRYDHYSTARTIEGALGMTATMTNNDKWATPYNEIFGAGGGTTTYSVPIVNPGAETGACGGGGSGAAAQGWTLTSATPQQVCYGTSGYPTTAQGPQPPASPGTAFFDGGASASAVMTQVDDVSSQAASIGTGTLPYTFSAWVGGYSSQGDNAGLVATFQNAGGSSLGTATLAPVTAAQRGNATKLLYESAAGTVPVGTVSVKITVTFNRTGGTDDDGYMDDVAMTFG
jgi:hypothetical protein